MKQKINLFPWILFAILLVTAPLLSANNQVKPSQQEDGNAPLVRDFEPDKKERRCDVEMDINIVTYVGEDIASASLCSHV